MADEAISPVCQFCGYSLVGLPKPVCPECGTKNVPPLPPLPPLVFRSREARPHVVCSINAVLCIAIMLLAPHTRRSPLAIPVHWDWGVAAALTAVLNFVLLLGLIVLFTRRCGTVAMLVTILICIVSLLGAVSMQIV